jgi:hypothetical protein
VLNTSIDGCGMSCSASVDVLPAVVSTGSAVCLGSGIGVCSLTASGSSILISASILGDIAGSVGVGPTRAEVAAGLFFVSFNRRASRFFSSVRRKTLTVVLRALLGLQSSAETGLCSQTGHDSGRVDWP